MGALLLHGVGREDGALTPRSPLGSRWWSLGLGSGDSAPSSPKSSPPLMAPQLRPHNPPTAGDRLVMGSCPSEAPAPQGRKGPGSSSPLVPPTLQEEGDSGGAGGHVLFAMPLCFSCVPMSRVSGLWPLDCLCWLMTLCVPCLLDRRLTPGPPPAEP